MQIDKFEKLLLKVLLLPPSRSLVSMLEVAQSFLGTGATPVITPLDISTTATALFSYKYISVFPLQFFITFTSIKTGDLVFLSDFRLE